MDLQALNLTPAYAEMFVLGAACIILLIDVFLRDEQRWLTATLTFAALAGAAAITTYVSGVNSRVTTLGDMYVADPMGDVLKLFTYLIVGVSLLYSREYLARRGLFRGEYYVLVLFAMLGIMVIISANSLLTIYLGIELLALSLYALVAFDRESGIAAESAMKYFVLGAIASGTLLYGISIIYGVTGTFQLDDLALALTDESAQNVGLLFGLAFLVVGIAFKFGAVPFHMWIPDVYHGAPTSVTLFIGSAPKIASFALAIRVLAEGLGATGAAWSDMLTVLAVLSMGLGNVVAIAQTNLKRMLAYSTISHVGFILLGILAGTPQGYQAAMYYTIAYTIMAVGSFGMILLLSRKGFEADELDDFKGLNQRSPWFAAVMLMFMFSTAGVPPFIGFFAKLYVILAVLDVGMVWLAAVAVFFSVIGAFYYIRVVKLMYFDEPQDTSPLVAGRSMRFMLSINGLAVLALGLLPGALLTLVARVLP
ncbi:MAG TPA: NADH-quinone oxidoreductase subunit NuoN [Steroidobacteraceae bacterium]